MIKTFIVKRVFSKAKTIGICNRDIFKYRCSNFFTGLLYCVADTDTVIVNIKFDLSTSIVPHLLITSHCATAPDCTPLCPTVPHCAPLCPTMPHCAPLCPTMPHCAPLCPTMPHCAPPGAPK